MDKRAAVTLTAFILAITLTAWNVAPQVVAIATAKSVTAGKLMQSQSTQGWVAFSLTLYHNGIDRATENRVTITNPALGSDASEWNTLGFASDTAAVNMTVTKIQNYDIEYTATGAGTQRVYCQGRSPPEVTSGGTGAWDASTGTLTVTTAAATTVHIHFPVISYATGQSLVFLWQFYPIIAFIILAGGAKSRHMNEAVYIMAAYTVAALISWLLYTWGL